MKWITRERPKIDRIACPWLIRRFIDPEAEIIFVPFEQVLEKAAALPATPFDIPGVEYSHYDDKCTFDYFLLRHNIQDKALERIAAIVRGADTDRHDFAPQSAGLEAIFAGLAHNIRDDHALLDLGMVIYDGLYSWATHLYSHKHTQAGPAEQMLLTVLHQYLGRKNKQKVPQWAMELKAILQDQVDSNMAANLKEVSKELDLNPAYLSREFSKYFDNMSYGDYMRKLRIDKAISLIETSDYSLTEIAYLTGFSDQSHFTRIFRLHTGTTPSDYKKSIKKSKKSSNG
ncbi:hypothetical protein SAMN05444266_109359 [Chitinophaga jiangningensis]|uniref:HTH araC/xylS-type domain-containing protein n=1 Tax=Chitinophaga jiangningensis TaxID=1419482 RepID=A0A1M7KJ25_9BACT|nr:chromate resistance protein ChrB domain-containing protein [Chitinophaga jiangningensis]SHM65390.1 hypothetical protein SAMN05444266_109359 [Chitinophaga jiangningensis]